MERVMELAQMTTAEYRNAAIELEAALKWAEAAEAWDKAIAAYPTARPGLADLDKARMTARRDACRAAA
jgi:hypothetical protein